MTLIKRAIFDDVLAQIKSPSRDIVFILGPRQVGKTTLLKEIQKQLPNSTYINCEKWEVQTTLRKYSIENIKKIFGTHKYILLDEVQHLPNMGQILKIVYDELPEYKVLATGSSSLDIFTKGFEPLTGRKIVYYMYPLWVGEIKNFIDDEVLNDILTYGLYPKVFLAEETRKKDYLEELTQSYLLKDTVSLGLVSEAHTVKELLQLLALQVGSEVSYTELANNLNIHVTTVRRYLDILEKMFIIFRLPAFSRNKRKEVVKSRKIYFWDIGVRNAIANDIVPFFERTNKGGIWENFIIAERLKRNKYKKQTFEYYFWRNYEQKEVDFIEVGDGEIYAYEIKYSAKKSVSFPTSFMQLYPNATFKIINRENYLRFLV